MRHARLVAAGLALLAGAFVAVRAAAPAPQDATDPVLTAEFEDLGGSCKSQGKAEARLQADGTLTVRAEDGPGRVRPPDLVEEYRLSLEERRALVELVRRVNFLGAPDGDESARIRPPGYVESRLRLSLDGRERERLVSHPDPFTPLVGWFHRWIHQTRLTGALRRKGDVRQVFHALHPRNEQIAQARAFRGPLREFAEKTEDPELLTVALCALAPLEEPAPWGALASRRAAALGADARFRVISGVAGSSHWSHERVTEAHRATLLTDLYEMVRAHMRDRAALSPEFRNRTDSFLQYLARCRHEPLFAAFPDIVRENLGTESAPGLNPLCWWGERGLDAVLALCSDPQPGMRSSAICALKAFDYMPEDRTSAGHPVPLEERARVRTRLLAEGIARLEAIREDSAETADLRRLARDEAKWILRRSEPKKAEPPLPPGVSLEVLGEDEKPLPGVPVRAVPTALRGQPDRSGRPIVVRESDAAGIARFERLDPGAWEFDVDDPALVRMKRSAIDGYREGTPYRLRLFVRQRRTFVGRLVGNSGRPLAGAAACRIDAADAPLEAESVADAEGRVTLPETPPGGKTRIRVRMPDGRTFLLEERFLQAGADWMVDFGPGGDGGEAPSVTGRVVGPDGTGLTAVMRVLAAGTEGPPIRTSVSRADGSFELYGLPPGAYRIGATHSDAKGTTSRRSPTAWLDVPAVPVTGAIVTIPLGGRIEGRVVDEAGTPQAGLYLVAELRKPADRSAPPDGQGHAPPPRGAASRVIATDEEGRFLFEDMQEGEYALHAGPRSPWKLTCETAVRTGAVDLKIRAIRCPPIVGGVRSKGGIALRDVEVIAVRLPGRDHECHATTELDGNFTLEGVDPGSDYECRVRLEIAEVPIQPLLVRAGDRVARIDVDVGEIGTILVRDRFGEPVPQFRLSLRQEGTGLMVLRTADRMGAVHLPYGATGRWRVERRDDLPDRERHLGIVEPDRAGQVISLPEEWR